MRQKIRPLTRDARFYGPPVSGHEHKWSPFKSPPEGADCVWCGEHVPDSLWRAHMVSEHYGECLLYWLTDLDEDLKRDPRWAAWKKVARFRFNEQLERLSTGVLVRQCWSDRRGVETG